MAAMRTDNRRLAILFVMAAVAVATSQDALVKLVSGDYPVHQVMAIRTVIAFPIVGYLAWHTGAAVRLPFSLWRWAALRGLIMCSAYLAFVLAFAALPMADVVAVYFTMPFFVAVLAWPALGERVRPHRWIAIIAGFGGVLLMNGLTHGIFDPAVLFALWSAAGYAIGQLMSRSITRYAAPATLAFHQNIVYGAVSLALAAVFGLLNASSADESLMFLMRPWAMPSGPDLAMMGAVGVLASISMVMFASAYKHAEASFIAPFEYTAMLWAILFGVTLWGHVPSPAMATGAAIVILAGLYMIWMDRRPAHAAGTTLDSPTTP
jgi:drug/metabolite transporter (DMT)-like permease